MTDQHRPKAPAERPVVPGFVVSTLLGFGSHGEVWLGTDVATGDVAALKVGRPPRSASGDPPGGSAPEPGGGAEGDAASDREIALLCRIHHPHVVRLHRVVDLADGRRALVLEHAAGGNLAALVAGRGALDPAEVTTVLVPLAQALAHLHGRGLVHGDLSPGNVLLSGDGRPLLSDLGVARVLGTAGPGPYATPGFTDPALTRGADPRAVDVWGLAAVAWFALSGGPPSEGSAALARPDSALDAPALTRLLAECLAPDPQGRPSPAEVASRAWQAAPPVPIRLLSAGAVNSALGGAPGTGEPSAAGVDAGIAAGMRAEAAAAARTTRRVRVTASAPAPAGGTGEGRRRAERPGLRAVARWAAGSGGGRRTTSRVLTAAVACVAVVIAVVAWRAYGYPSGAASRVAAPAQVEHRADGSQDVSGAVMSIGRARAEAFATASTAPLQRANEPGSPAMTADSAVVQRLVSRGWRLQDVSFTIDDARVVRREGAMAWVTATVTTSAHRQVAAGGRVVAQVPPDGPRQVTLTLVATSGEAGWRVRAVS